jgi:hypothetical protein
MFGRVIHSSRERRSSACGTKGGKRKKNSEILHETSPFEPRRPSAVHVRLGDNEGYSFACCAHRNVMDNVAKVFAIVCGRRKDHHHVLAYIQVR